MENIRYFASDQEFEDFCVAPYAEIRETADGVMYVSALSQERCHIVTVAWCDMGVVEGNSKVSPNNF